MYIKIYISVLMINYIYFVIQKNMFQARISFDTRTFVMKTIEVKDFQLKIIEINENNMYIIIVLIEQNITILL